MAMRLSGKACTFGIHDANIDTVRTKVPWKCLGILHGIWYQPVAPKQGRRNPLSFPTCSCHVCICILAIFTLLSLARAGDPDPQKSILGHGNFRAFRFSFEGFISNLQAVSLHLQWRDPKIWIFLLPKSSRKYAIHSPTKTLASHKALCIYRSYLYVYRRRDRYLDT